MFLIILYTSLYHDGSEDSLKALIHARQQSRGAQMDNFSDSLEQKYAKKQKGSSKAGGRTRHHMEKKQDVVHDITVTCVVVVVILNSYCMSATV